MILFQAPAPVPFWESPAFTTAIVLLVGAVIAYFQSRTNAKVNTTAEKVATIETHTNGMLTALQTKVDTQNVEAQHLAEVTDLNKKIALQANPGDRPTP
jgi:hypothetical protein